MATTKRNRSCSTTNDPWLLCHLEIIALLLAEDRAAARARGRARRRPRAA